MENKVSSFKTKKEAKEVHIKEKRSSCRRKFKVSITGLPMLVLVDFDSTHCFIDVSSPPTLSINGDT